MYVVCCTYRIEETITIHNTPHQFNRTSSIAAHISEMNWTVEGWGMRDIGFRGIFECTSYVQEGISTLIPSTQTISWSSNSKVHAISIKDEKENEGNSFNFHFIPCCSLILFVWFQFLYYFISSLFLPLFISYLFFIPGISEVRDLSAIYTNTGRSMRSIVDDISFSSSRKSGWDEIIKHETQTILTPFYVSEGSRRTRGGSLHTQDIAGLSTRDR